MEKRRVKRDAKGTMGSPPLTSSLDDETVRNVTRLSFQIASLVKLTPLLNYLYSLFILSFI